MKENKTSDDNYAVFESLRQNLGVLKARKVEMKKNVSCNVQVDAVLCHGIILVTRNDYTGK